MKEKKPINFWLLLLITIGPIVLIIFLIDALSPDVPKERNLPGEAWLVCKGFISDQLKAPSTADFERIDFDKINKINDSTFDMTITVDAQNSFGVKLRSAFYCKTYLDDTNTWRLVELREK